MALETVDGKYLFNFFILQAVLPSPTHLTYSSSYISHLERIMPGLCAYFVNTSIIASSFYIVIMYFRSMSPTHLWNYLTSGTGSLYLRRENEHFLIGDHLQPGTGQFSCTCNLFIFTVAW